ncbi:LysR family transcriptional regulator [Streptomyces sioyaensis]|uniref:LysR family transcriptional regulator n=1 Tax=Streptomyces sioyaensis TaxID=67364 RepID=UPI0033E0FB5C
MVSLSALQTLRELRRHGSVHAAAKMMHLAPSSVSQRIKGLSEQCGVPLFERSGRGGQLTEEGVAAAELADKIVLMWERGLLNIRSGSSTTLRRAIRIGAFPSALAHCVLPAAERLRRQEFFHVELLEVDPREAVSLVEHAQLDAALTLGEILDADLTLDPRLTQRVLWRESFALVLPRAFVTMGSLPRSIRGFTDMPWVLPRRGSACDLLLGRHLARMGVRPRAVARSDDWSLVQRMAGASEAVALIPVSCLEMEDSGLQTVEIPPEELPERTVVVLESVEAAGSRFLPPVRQELARAAEELMGRINTPSSAPQCH